MTQRYDVPPGDDAMLDVRGLLGSASAGVEARPVDLEAHWARGRARRVRRRAGGGGLALATVAAVGGLVWQTGLLGGADDPDPTVAATVPDGLTTFVFSAQGAPAPDVTALEGDGAASVRVPAAGDLTGTEWVLQDQVWGGAGSSSSVVGADAGTTLTFGDGPGSAGWGFSTDGCGGGWADTPPAIGEDGRFGPGAPMGTMDIGCPEPAQVAEDFWLDVLPRGGEVHLLGDDVLLLSVDTGTAGQVAPPPPVAAGDRTRLVFLRDGVDPARVDLDGPEEAADLAAVAGTTWQLAAGADDRTLAGLLPDPGLLRLDLGEGLTDPDAGGLLELGYGDGRADHCVLARRQVLGIDGVGRLGDVAGRVNADDSAPLCTDLPEARSALGRGLDGEVRLGVIGEDVLVLRLPLPTGPASPTGPSATGPSATGPSATGPSTADPPAASVEPSAAEEPSGPPAQTAQTPDPPAAVPTTPADPTTSADPPTDPPDVSLPGFVDALTPLARPDLESWWDLEHAPAVAVTGIRVATHEGFDRVVLDLDVDGQPRWRLRYEDPATGSGGAGVPVDLPGDAVLALDLVGVPYPTDVGAVAEPGSPSQRVPIPVTGLQGLPTITGVETGGPFEAHLDVFIGLPDERPYRALLLEDPMRLVVDVQH